MLSELEGILDTEGEAQISVNVAGGEASAAAGDGPWGLLSTLGGILGVREQAVEDVVVPETVAGPEGPIPVPTDDLAQAPVDATAQA